MKSALKRVIKIMWRIAVRFGKRYRYTNNLLEQKILPAINKYKYGRLSRRMITARELYEEKFKQARSFRAKIEPGSKIRINILYEDFDRKSFFGGKATALIIANLLASRYNFSLRIVGTNINPEVYDMFLDVFGMDRVEGVEYRDFNKNNTLEVGEGDIFIATNGFNARSIIDNELLKNRNKLFYIMQEVETMFYDHGDTYLFMSQIMKHPSVIPIVNTRLLYDWFCEKGYDNVKANGMYFEPAFPLAYKTRHVNKKSKKPYKLFFYARPAHQRNLFYFGIKMLDRVFATGALNPDEWVIYFSDDGTTPSISFDSGVGVEKLPPMDWLEYNQFLRDVDLTYGMMYTPHPSYPPLDTAMMGGVVVANTYANKKTLSNYSQNIVTADLTEDSMLAAFSKAEQIVKNDELRKKYYRKNNINNSWHDALKDVIAYMKDRIDNV